MCPCSEGEPLTAVQMTVLPDTQRPCKPTLYLARFYIIVHSKQFLVLENNSRTNNFNIFAKKDSACCSQ